MSTLDGHIKWTLNGHSEQTAVVLNTQSTTFAASTAAAQDGHSPDTTLIMGIHSTFSAATVAAAAKFISN